VQQCTDGKFSSSGQNCPERKQKDHLATEMLPELEREAKERKNKQRGSDGKFQRSVPSASKDANGVVRATGLISATLHCPVKRIGKLLMMQPKFFVLELKLGQ